MNKNSKVIIINGVRGIITAVFTVLGLIAGFIISPGWVCMKLWNLAAEHYAAAVSLNIYQGVLLWVLIALILYALNNKRLLIGFRAYPNLSSETIKDIMQKSNNLTEAVLQDAKTSKKGSEVNTGASETINNDSENK